MLLVSDNYKLFHDLNIFATEEESVARGFVFTLSIRKAEPSKRIPREVRQRVGNLSRLIKACGNTNNDIKMAALKALGRTIGRKLPIRLRPRGSSRVRSGK